MGESSELQSEENKASLEKNKKRKLKTPTQVFALEKFYNEHKYPTEEMKLELAEELGLTEKQVSGWFCHRRLKDKRMLKEEVCASGRQDLSSGVIQDRGSGLGQDSCGSTKHGDYRHLDPKEVESCGLYGHDGSVAHMTYERWNPYTENVGGMDDTSSESSSSLQGQLFPQGQDPYDMEPSRYLTPNGALPPINPTRYKPSGYLKVKGETENPAVTAVKKQLGRHYWEDGPLLGVEFDPLPPGAFECQIADPVHEPCYIANPALRNSSEISAVKRQPSLSSRYDSYNTKFSSQDSHLEGAEHSDFQDKKSPQHIKQRLTMYGCNNPWPSRNSSLDLYEHSTAEASAYNSNKSHRIGTKHGVEGMKLDSASNHSDHYEGNFEVDLTDSLLHGYDNVNLMNVQKSEYVKSKPSNSISNPCVSVDTEDRGISTKMAKEKKYSGDRKARKQYDKSAGVRTLSNEITVAKRVFDLPLQHDVKQAPVAEAQSQRSHRSAMEMSSSFSEDETADIISSVD